MLTLAIVALITAQAGAVTTGLPDEHVVATDGDVVHLSQTVNADELVAPTVDRGAWRSGKRRWFAATTVDLGYIYLRPRLSLGYGAPHFQWMGIEMNPIFSRQAIGAWGGVRFALPYIDIRAGARTAYQFERSYLPGNIASFDRAALETSGGNHGKYTTLETELNTAIATKVGELSLLGSASRVTGFDDPNQYVYEDTLRLIVGTSLVWRARAQFAFYPIPSFRQFAIGPAVDVLGVPTRDEILVRAGFVTRIVFNKSLEVRGSFVPTIVSRDRLGLITSDFTELGLRWRWATE